MKDPNITSREDSQLKKREREREKKKRKERERERVQYSISKFHKWTKSFYEDVTCSYMELRLHYFFLPQRILVVARIQFATTNSTKKGIFLEHSLDPY